METAVATAFLGKIAPKLFTFLQEKHERRRSLERDIQYIRKEFRMIAAAIQDHDRLRRSDGTDGDVQRAWIQLVRELAYDIEDCIDRFMHRVTPAEAGASWVRQTVRRVKTASTRQKFAAAIRELRKISEEASRLRACYASSADQSSPSSTSCSGAFASTFSASASETHTLAADLVGMDAPRDELLELMRETEGQPKQLKVISIVGFGGLGKTVLAREVYDSVAAGSGMQYQHRAWIRAADNGAGDVLKQILQELGIQVEVHGGSCDVIKLSTSIREFLGSKRFLIVIDDMRTEFWNIIKNVFPAITGVSSRVIVTTTTHSIANACSSAHGHVYVMRTLDEEHSRKLFFKEASVEDPPPDTELGSEALKKCDGLPLALVTTAQFLQSRGNPTRIEWAKLCHNLGEHLETKDTLARMKRVLVQSYTSLPDHVLKACLLYLGIFQSGRPVRKQSLIRRWLAEGLVEEFGVGADKFKELVDRNIVQPVHVNNNAEVKTCQTHGMMLEFILRKSISERFITVLYGEARPSPGVIRWLSLHQYSGNPNKDLSLLRSLTIFGKAHKSVLEFSKYKQLRVLDLEECDDHLDEKHLSQICNLFLLRYLSLGGSITVLPKEFSKLKYLETLDVRRTKIKVLPIQVIKMTSLIHLFGVFKLQDVGRKMSKLQTFLSEKSNLETLAGFVADKSQGQGFPQLMNHMEHLKKVKIWCESPANGSSNSTHLSKAIQGFLQRGTNVNVVRSLSLSFKEWSEDLLNFSLENLCYLNSLKLHGTICSLPPFVPMLGGLTELCLSSPHQLSGDILAAVSRVRSLHYLKLVASEVGSFEIERGVFQCLRRLCIVVQFVTGLEIREGALPGLESLRLLCKDLNGVCGIKIERLGRLKEVALHDGVSEGTKRDWKEAARNHPRRPKVLFVETREVDDGMQIASEPAEDSAPTPVADVQTELARLMRGCKRSNETSPDVLGRLEVYDGAGDQRKQKRAKVLFAKRLEEVDQMQMELTRDFKRSRFF